MGNGRSSKLSMWLGVPRTAGFLVLMAAVLLGVIALGALDVSAYWTCAVIAGVVLLGGSLFQFAYDGARRGFRILGGTALFFVTYLACGGTGMFTFSESHLWNFWSAVGGLAAGLLAFRGFLYLTSDDAQ